MKHKLIILKSIFDFKIIMKIILKLIVTVFALTVVLGEITEEHKKAWKNFKVSLIFLLETQDYLHEQFLFLQRQNTIKSLKMLPKKTKA